MGRGPERMRVASRVNFCAFCSSIWIRRMTARERLLSRLLTGSASTFLAEKVLSKKIEWISF